MPSLQNSDDTIFAPATGSGRTAVAIVRVSGSRAGAALQKIAGILPAPREARLAKLAHPSTGGPIDRGLVLWFPGPASFTGEDCAEFHLHGGRAVVKALVEALAAIDGLRPAEPGEFTRRAFANGKLDLAAAEGLADLIDAETETQRRQALRQMNGEIADRVAPWRQVLIETQALIAAEIDFADEGEAPSATLGSVLAQVEPVLAEIERIVQSGRAGEIVRDGFSIVIAGPPNAGKSTLLNALAKRDVAIVSAYAGTTRDIIEVRLDLDGLLIVLADTAGLRPSDDPIEQEGMARSRGRIAEADLVLWLSQDRCEDNNPKDYFPNADCVTVRTKLDLAPLTPHDGVAISALTGQGIPALMALIKEKAAAATGGQESTLIARLRHRQALMAAADCLRVLTKEKPPLEIASEYLRLASRSLESLIGRIDVEEVLDAIFAKFCMGK